MLAQAMCPSGPQMAGAHLLGPHPHDAHVVHAHKALIALLRAVDLLLQLLSSSDVVSSRGVHPLQGQPAGLQVERGQAGARALGA